METAILVNFKEKFHTLPPAWFEEIEKKADRRITSAPFAEVSRMGKKEAMDRLMLNLWPFVKVFPKLVRNGYIRLFSPRMYMRFGIGNMMSLSYHSIVFLSGIESDESNHRDLWLGSSAALGLAYPKDFERPITPETQAWIDEVAQKTDPADMFLAFVAIEFIAESISKDLLKSEQFKNVFGNSKNGLGWFAVHTVDHGDVSHANLELHLSLAFRPQTDEHARESAERVILGVVDKFLAAANACV